MPNTILHKRGTTEPTAGVLTTGELAINTGDGTVYTKLDDGTVTLIGSKSSRLEVAVRNETGSAIPAGSAVYITGASNGKPLVSLAQANAEMTSSKTLGLTTTAINSGHNGSVILFGTLDKIDTQAYTAGQALWLSATVAGGLTTTPPVAPNHAVFIGIVITSANNGKIEVRVANGYELEELHNVLITSPTDKDLISYESATGLYKNKSALSLGIAELANPSFTGTVNVGGANGVQISSGAFIIAGGSLLATDDRSYFTAESVYTVNGTIGRGGVYSQIGGVGFPVAYSNATALWLTSTASGTPVETIVVDGKLYSKTNNGSWIEPYVSSANLSGYAPLSGATFTGKVTLPSPTSTTASLNIGSALTAPTSTSAGDIWIGTNINYRDNVGTSKAVANTNTSNTFSQPQIISTATSATLPAIRITNQGTASTAHSLLVEDSANPDTTSFIINNAGNVGIGVASGYTPVGKLDVNGIITASTPAVGTDSSSVATTSFVKSSIVPTITTYTDGQWLPSYVTDWNSIFRLNFTTDQSVQLPTDSQSTAVIGTQVVFLQLGSGRLNFNPTNGNTVMSSGGKYYSVQQYSVVTAIKTGSNEWLIAGDLAVS